MMEDKSVGLVVAVKIKNEYRLVLAVRGIFDNEKNQTQTYAGATQVLVHGRLEKKESYQQALVREAKEELGQTFSKIIKNNIKKLIPLGQNDARTYGFLLSGRTTLKKIKLNSSLARLRLIGEKDIKKIKPLRTTDRERQVKAGIKMFPDEIKAVKRFFRIIKKS